MSDENFSRSFATETWTLYAFGVSTIALRLTERIRRLNIKGLKADDYVMINGLVWYTILCVSFNQIASGGGSNLLAPGELGTLTPENIEERIRGSKWVLVSEHAMVLTVWSMKACMLMLYASITQGLRQKRYVNWVSIYVALGFVGSELALFLTCRPFNQYWAVPPSSVQCSTFQYYEIINAAFNIPGDIAMLAIGIPLVSSLQIPIQQKIILLLVFGMGGFIVVASILTKVYCLVPELISYVYMNWYFREASVSVYVTNLPAIWPLLRDIFPRLKSWGSRANGGEYHQSTAAGGTRTWTTGSSGVRIGSQDFGMTSLPGNDNSSSLTTSQSQDFINGSDEELNKRRPEQNGLEILRDVTYTVQSHSVDGVGRRDSSGRAIGWHKGTAVSITADHAVNQV